MKGRKIVWTKDMIEDLNLNYPTEYNKSIAKRLGIGWRSIVRKARELGLEKEEGFLEKRRDEISTMAAEAHPEHAMKGVKGWSVPGGEKHRFKKGHVSPMATDPEIVKKVHESRNETIRKERLRLRYGLDQKTKLKLNTW